ncbi:solute carrier family 22 member 21-like [Antedon mediterranea]|uniref:solute carrier family 22 member 21-like n=1 Tax=Antedon mediterranea TaxID=105859 RepID=UPI003AF647C8
MECGGDENNNTDRLTILYFDDIFKHIGSCNRYFLLSFLVLSLCITSVGWNSLAVVFLFPETDFWCQMDDVGDRCLELNLDRAGCSALKHGHHPVDKPSTVLNETQCSRYDLTEYDFNSNTTLNNDTLYICIGGYEFDTTQYKTSITQEFELVCGDAYLVPLALSLQYVGVLVGSGIFGCISDRLGRKRTLVLCMTTYICCNIVTLLSQWYWMYVAATTISAAFFEGAIISTYVIGK